MPPTSPDPKQQLSYFIRLLAALCLQGGGSLTIDMAHLRAIDEDGSRQALVEETDCANDCVVLRYGSKHSAMYPVEPLSQPQTQPRATTQSSPVLSPNISPAVPPRKPLSVNELRAAERKIQQARMAAELRAERAASSQMPPDEWVESLLRPRNQE